MNTVKAFYTKYIKPWVKALASAVGGAIAGLLINWLQGTTPIPTTKDGLYTLLIATLVPPILALFAPTNKITQKQLDKDPNVIGGTVVENPPAGIPGPTGTIIDGTINIKDFGGGGGGAAGSYPSSWR